MASYQALTLLSLADGRHVAPGELLDLDQAAAEVLSAAGAVLGPALVEVAEAMEAAGLSADELASPMPDPPPAPTRPRRRRS